MKLKADRRYERKQGIIYELPVAAGAHIFAGSLVSVNAEGYLVPSSNNETEKFLGVSRKESDNEDGGNGDVLHEGYLTGIFQMNAMGVTQADILSDAYVVDDNTVSTQMVKMVSLDGTQEAEIPRHQKVGRIIEVIPPKSVFVEISVASRS